MLPLTGSVKHAKQYQVLFVDAQMWSSCRNECVGGIVMKFRLVIASGGSSRRRRNIGGLQNLFFILTRGLFFSLLLERGRERKTSLSCPTAHALTRDRTCNLSVYGMALQLTEPPARAVIFFLTVVKCNTKVAVLIIFKYTIQWHCLHS